MAFDKLMGFDRFINILIVISGSDTETYSRCKDSGFSYNVCINPFVPNAPFPYPLKTENCKVFLMVFFGGGGGQRKGASGANWLSLSFRTLWIRKNSRFSDILNQCLFSLLAAGTVKFFSKEMFRACQNEKCVSSPPVGFCKKASFKTGFQTCFWSARELANFMLKTRICMLIRHIIVGFKS